jgi:hypothetical protein
VADERFTNTQLTPSKERTWLTQKQMGGSVQKLFFPMTGQVLKAEVISLKN